MATNMKDVIDQVNSLVEEGKDRLSQMIDQVDANNMYQGFALPGTYTGQPKWRIRKIATSGTITSILFANGNTSFTNIWDNRASLTYL